MKKLLVLFIISLSFLTSCEKESEEESPCPIVDAKLIPPVVSNALSEKYPKQEVIIWFNQDNKGYTAYFLNNGIKTLASFSNDGRFIKVEIKGKHHQNGNHRDGDDDEDEEEGCDCDID